MVRTVETGYKISYIFILFNVLTGVAFTNSFLTLRMFYEERMKNFLPTNIAREVLAYLPSYSFSTAFGLMSAISARDFDVDAMIWTSP
jgi:hypothetical protein